MNFHQVLATTIQKTYVPSLISYVSSSIVFDSTLEKKWLGQLLDIGENVIFVPSFGENTVMIVKNTNKC